jgi:hypothetical protein
MTKHVEQCAICLARKTTLAGQKDTGVQRLLQCTNNWNHPMLLGQSNQPEQQTLLLQQSVLLL